MVDVGVLDCERAACGGDELVVRRTVDAAVGDPAVLQTRGELLDGGVLGAHGRDAHRVERPDGVDEADHAGRDQVDALERLAHHGDVVGQAIWRVGTLGHDEEAVPACEACEPAASLVGVQRELRGVRERHGHGLAERGEALRAGVLLARCRVPAGAAGQGQGR